MGICLRCSLDYSGIMPRIFMLLFSRVVILYFLRSSEKLDRKVFSFFRRFRKFHNNVPSVYCLFISLLTYVICLSEKSVRSSLD